VGAKKLKEQMWRLPPRFSVATCLNRATSLIPS